MIDALLDHYRQNMTLDEALDRVQRNIDVGRSGWADPELLAALEIVHRAARSASAGSFPVDEISDAPWVVERGSIAWMIREGEGGPQVGNFILEADARWVAAQRSESPTSTPASAPRRATDCHF